MQELLLKIKQEVFSGKVLLNVFFSWLPLHDVFSSFSCPGYFLEIAECLLKTERAHPLE